MAAKIALDAMGGDHAPGEIVRGAVLAAESFSDIEIVLIGEESLIREELRKSATKIPFEIIHTDTWIGMDEDPKQGVKEKPGASINIAARMVNDGYVHGIVSAGNTGATILAAASHIPVIEGIERTALATVYPTAKFDRTKRGFGLMLDVGATLQCSSRQLVHFAFMGNFYLSEVFGFERPRIGLLNIGEEETKGGENLKRTYQLAEKSRRTQFYRKYRG